MIGWVGGGIQRVLQKPRGHLHSCASVPLLRQGTRVPLVTRAHAQQDAPPASTPPPTLKGMPTAILHPRLRYVVLRVGSGKSVDARHDPSPAAAVRPPRYMDEGALVVATFTAHIDP